MAALMRSTDEDRKTNSKLARDDIESQRKRKQKRETVLNFEELFEKNVEKEGEPIEQIQAEHEERLFEALSSLSKSQRQLYSQ